MKATNDQIVKAYRELGSVWLVGDRLGMCGQSVHERLQKIGALQPRTLMGDAGRARLLADYNRYADEGRLSELAVEMGWSTITLSRHAKVLGLTNSRRRKSAAGIEKFKAARARKNWRPPAPVYGPDRPHPRGFSGKTHSMETREKLGAISRKMWSDMSEEKRAATVLKMTKASVAAGNLRGPHEKTTWKAGWREIGGKRIYFRSRWEANYGRYLEWLKVTGNIVDWEHEPETFWFDGVRRGSVSYLPDFRVKESDGTIVYHEVKGWMDDRSRVKLERMARYHPEVKLIVIKAAEYRSIERKAKYLVPGWENGKG